MRKRLLLAAAVKQPHVLPITVDTLRADHLSSYGYHLRTSPRMGTYRARLYIRYGEIGVRDAAAARGPRQNGVQGGAC